MSGEDVRPDFDRQTLFLTKLGPWPMSLPTATVWLHTPSPPGTIGGAIEAGTGGNLHTESLCDPKAGLSEILIPAGYVKTVYDPVFKLSADVMRYVPTLSDEPTPLADPGMPFSRVFRCEPGRGTLLK